jgi:hypothetical protein
LAKIEAMSRCHDLTIDEMMGGGLITLEKANVIIYRPQDKR